MTAPARDVVLPTDSAVYQQCSSLAKHAKIALIAGLPAVGKSLFVQQTALLSADAGRTVHLLQWDVARAVFESADSAAKYPPLGGATHSTVRRAVGIWGRAAVLRWHEQHTDAHHILIGEMPLVGGRFTELTQVSDDSCEPLLASRQTQILVPVPTVEVRRHIEAARAATFAAPSHEHEAEDAPPEVVVTEWRLLHSAAVALELADIDPNPEYDPDVYGALYRHLLVNRNHVITTISDVFPIAGSVYDRDIDILEVMPSADEVTQTFEVLESTQSEAEIQEFVSQWSKI